ncbi:Tropomodulin [Brachionus plicatilis]|uniref:Tropomodulin n=1 Tax=Brachionus plicatilis TaxID=10195 RepID=A0A3M7RNE8_BRAPC|nr:Tropomodulin [Brachionus plicatilis]
MSVKQRDFSDVDFDEIDALLSQLTEEELECLAGEVDPDDPHLPPSERCRDQTKKQPTGPYDREKLLKYLEDQGKNEKDWEQNKEFKKEIRGKVWVPPPKPVEEEHQELEHVATEWDEILNGASEAEIVELAAILGFTGLVNQVQFHAAEKSDLGISFGGWNAAAKSETLKFVPPEPDNKTDVEESIKKLQENDSSLCSLNLNNIKNISHERMKQVIEAMKTNTNCKNLSMANIEMPDSVAKTIVDMLEENTSLLTLNIESNLLTGFVIADICRATLKNQTLIDLRMSNQRAQILGNKVEMDIANSISQNSTLLRLGIHFNTLGPRAKVQDVIKRNWDNLRLKRINEKTQKSTTNENEDQE